MHPRSKGRHRWMVRRQAARQAARKAARALQLQRLYLAQRMYSPNAQLPASLLPSMVLLVPAVKRPDERGQRAVRRQRKARRQWAARRQRAAG